MAVCVKNCDCCLLSYTIIIELTVEKVMKAEHLKDESVCCLGYSTGL